MRQSASPSRHQTVGALLFDGLPSTTVGELEAEGGGWAVHCPSFPDVPLCGHSASPPAHHAVVRCAGGAAGRARGAMVQGKPQPAHVEQAGGGGGSGAGQGSTAVSAAAPHLPCRLESLRPAQSRSGVLCVLATRVPAADRRTGHGTGQHAVRLQSGAAQIAARASVRAGTRTGQQHPSAGRVHAGAGCGAARLHPLRGRRAGGSAGAAAARRASLLVLPAAGLDGRHQGAAVRAHRRPSATAVRQGSAGVALALPCRRLACLSQLSARASWSLRRVSCCSSCSVVSPTWRWRVRWTRRR